MTFLDGAHGSCPTEGCDGVLIKMRGDVERAEYRCRTCGEFYTRGTDLEKKEELIEAIVAVTAEDDEEGEGEA